MIFPQDVHKVIQNKSRIAGDNKVQLIIVLFVLGNFFCFFGLMFLMSLIAPNMPIGVVIAIQLVIIIAVGIIFFRFYIFDESAKKREYQGQQSDSFTRYMSIRKDNIRKTESGISVFEYIDGSATFAVEFRFGSNDDIKAEGTSQFYKEFMKLVATYGFESRAIISSEDFRTSDEYYHYTDLINQNEDKTMRRIMTVMADTVFDVSAAESSVDKVTLLVRSVYSYQKSDLELLLRSFIGLLGKGCTAFRTVRFLDLNTLIALYQDFYGIAAIDLAMMKTVSLASDISEDFAAYIKVLSLTGNSGKTYTSKKPETLVTVSERALN